MIDKYNLLPGLRCAIWMDATDASELAQGTEFAVTHQMPAIAVVPDAVPVIWPWVEGRGIEIGVRVSSTANRGAASQLTPQIKAAFMQGADGAIISMTPRGLEKFADDMCIVRNDLFFDKKMTIMLDLNDIDDCNAWAGVFDALGRVGANRVMLTWGGDDGDASDFVGRVYGMLGLWDQSTFDGDMHFALGADITRVIQTSRLVEKMQPRLSPRVVYYIPF